MSAVDNIRAALAAGPTPGPWNKTVLDTDMHDKSDSTYVRGMKLDECVFVGAAVTSPTKHVVLAPFDYNDSPEGMCSPNAAYIAACNPAAMTEVLAHIDAQERRIEGYKSQANTDLSMLIRQNSEIERLKADAARYQWLRKTTNYATSNGEKVDVRNFPELWDASIDSMIAETPKEQP